jgi:hypothetical protein
MILIAGDSWACGEYHPDWIQRSSLPERNLPDQFITHNGLYKFIKDDGYQVLNLANPGGCNIGNCKRLNDYFISNSDHQVEKIFIFQTDWCRDIDYFSNVGQESRPWPRTDLNMHISECNYALHYRDVALSTFYTALSKLSQVFDVNIVLIGGLSDVLAYDRFSIEYPGLSCVCRSAVSLAVFDDANAEPLTTGFLTPNYAAMADHIKRQLSSDQLPVLVEEINLGNRRQQLFQKRRDLFPDGWHGGRLVHQKIYELLKAKKII